jgi:hypothetical protein
MLKSIYIKLTSIKFGNLFVERSLKLFYSILSLYLGSNFFLKSDFFVLQQITLFQSFLLFTISLPVNSILVRIGNVNINYFKSLIFGTVIFRFVAGSISLGLFSIYLLTAKFDYNDISIILIGLLPILLSNIFITDILPHVYDFEGRKNWELVFIYLLFLVIKCLMIIFFKSILVKIVIELIEMCVVILWSYSTYLKGFFREIPTILYLKRVLKYAKISTGLYLNGILSVFILRIDQFALLSFVDKNTMSSYMLVVTIASLFLTPMGLISDKLAFVMSIAKSESIGKFSDVSKKSLKRFLVLSIFLFLLFVILFNPISQIVFNRNLKNFFTVAVILGTSIISNSIGMIFGQINSIMNGGVFTMKRSLFGCIILVLSVNLGFYLFGLTGVAIASASSLFVTNVIFWFFSKKVKRIIFYKSKVNYSI